jgi:CelD/BcsL family acetyltransferase involved in cellulose biosynthesis
MQLSLYNTFPDELEAEWNALLAESVTHVPFLRFEYLKAWWQTRGGGEWPQAELVLVTASQEGRLIGIAPLFFTPDHKQIPSLMLLGSIEISDYLDIICRPEQLEEFLRALLPFLESELPYRWQALDLYNLLDSSPTLAVLEKVARLLQWQWQVERLQHSPFIILPGDWEIYLSGLDKKQRHEIRRKMRRAEESERKIHWYSVEDPATFEDEVDAFLALMAKDVQKAAFLTEPMRTQMRQVMRCAFEHQCLRLVFLEVDGVKAAGYLNFDYLNQIWVYNSGIDQQFNELSPGWVLLGYLLKWSNEHQRKVLDFMRGDEEYKYRFGARDRYVMRAVLQPN